MCFQLLSFDSSDISNTAFATLKQLFIIVFDRVEVSSRTKIPSTEPENINESTQQKVEKEILAEDCLLDGYDVFNDLCLLANDNPSIFMSYPKPDKSFVLEILESVISSHFSTLDNLPLFKELIRTSLVPLLINSFSENSTFNLSVRHFRLALVFIDKFHSIFPVESQLFITVFIYLISPNIPTNPLLDSFPEDETLIDSESKSPRQMLSDFFQNTILSEIPGYMIVLSSESLLTIFSDTKLFLELFNLYDYSHSSNKTIHNIVRCIGIYIAQISESFSSGSDSASKSVKSITEYDNKVGHLNKQDMSDSISVTSFSNSSQKSQSVNLISKTKNSNLKLSFLDSVDRFDEPNITPYSNLKIPLYCLVELSKGFSSLLIPLVSQSVLVNSRESSSSSSKRTLVLLNEMQNLDRIVDDSDRSNAEMIHSFLAESWPELLASTNFLSSIPLDEAEQVSIALAMENFTKILGAINIDSGCTSFLLALCKSSLPNFEISILERNRSNFQSDAVKEFLLSPGGFKPLSTESFLPIEFSLSKPQILSLCAVSDCARFLAPVLNEKWYTVIVTLQQAEELLYQRKLNIQNSLGESSINSQNEYLANLNESSNGDIQRAFIDHRLIVSEYEFLFDLVPTLDEKTFGWFVVSLCILNSDFSGAPSRDSDIISINLIRRNSNISRRMLTLLNRVAFPIKYLLSLAKSHMNKLLTIKSPFDSDSDKKSLWDLFVYQLLDTATFINTPQPLRLQASEALSDAILTVMSYVVSMANESVNLENDPGFEITDVSKSFYGDAQVQALMPLSEMMTNSRNKGDAQQFVRFSEVQNLALSTLNQLLQASGHSIVNAWGVVFDILNSAIMISAPDKSNALSLGSSNYDTLSNQQINSSKPLNLIRLAFPSLQLICSDFIGNLSPNYIRRCLFVLQEYSKQSIDMNVALTSVGLMWSINDYLIAQNIKLPENLKSNIPSDPKISDPSLGGLLEAFLNDKNLPFKTNNSKLWDHFHNIDLGEILNETNSQILFLLVLRSLCFLCIDSRHELRSSSIQTLFSTLEVYNDHLNSWCWDVVLWAIVTPLLAQVSINRTKSLVSDWVISPIMLDEGLSVENPIKEGLNNDVPQDFNLSKYDIARNIVEPDSKPTPEMSKSGIYLEDPRVVRIKTWDETLLTLISKTCHIWVSKYNSALVNTTNVNQALVSFLSWLIVNISGCHNPITFYKLIFNYIFNKSISNIDLLQGNTETKFESDYLYSFYKYVFSIPGIKFTTPISLSIALVDMILDSIVKLTKNFSPIENISEKSLNSGSQVTNFEMFFWDTTLLMSHISSDPLYRKAIDDSKSIIDNSVRSGFNNSHYIILSDTPKLLISNLGPLGSNSLDLSNYKDLIFCLKSLLFAEFNLESEDVYSMSQLQSSVLDNINSIIELFSKDVYSNNAFSDNESAEAFKLKIKSNFLASRITLVSNILPECLEFLCNISTLPIVNLLYSESPVPDKPFYPSGLPPWAVSTLEYSRKWSLIHEYQHFNSSAYSTSVLNQYRTTTSWKPSYISLSQNAVISINGIISKLRLLEFLDLGFNASLFDQNDLSSSLFDDSYTKVKLNEMIKFSAESGLNIQFIFLLERMVFRGLLTKTISSTALFLVSWDCFRWKVLESRVSLKISEDSSIYSILLPLWSSCAKSMSSVINYSFETLSRLYPLKVQSQVDSVWILLNQIMEDVLFLPNSVINDWQFLYSQGNLHCDTPYQEKSQSVLDSLNFDLIFPQFECNYSFRDVSVLNNNFFILRCPPPKSSSDDVLNTSSNLGPQSSNHYDSNDVNLNVEDFHIKSLNNFVLASLRFVSSIVNLALEEEDVERNVSFKKGNWYASSLLANEAGDLSNTAQREAQASDSINFMDTTFKNHMYSHHIDGMFDLLHKISTINHSSLSPKIINTRSYKLSFASQADLAAPYKSIEFYSQGLSLSLSALHWLFVSSSQESSVIPSLYKGNSSSFDFMGFNFISESPSVNYSIKEVFEEFKKFEISLVPSCFTEIRSSDESDNENSVESLHQENCICVFGPFPKFSERPLVPFYVSEISTKYLLKSSICLISQYLSPVIHYPISIYKNNSPFDNNSKFVFENDIQLLFLISHLLRLNCRYNIFDHMINLCKLDNPMEILRNVIAYPHSNIKRLIRYDKIISADQFMSEYNNHIDDNELFNSIDKALRDSHEVTSYDKYVSQISKSMNIDHSSEHAQNGSNNPSISPKELNKREIYLNLLSSPHSHLFILFDFISALSLTNDVIGIYATKCKEMITDLIL
ncbi:Protein MON2-like protein [Smittium mucronatum]|uniref:Protein MON2-like protein n=1 Tax=Smittium mucronatum TaxID=133383 RepID=A0A1R0GXH8_9FUNG|nr:Protein MON2-like protein [Smittium mucronatum]